MLKTKKEIKAMDKVTKKFYEFLEACEELRRATGISVKNHNTFVGDYTTEDLRNDLVQRFNNASKDVFGR